MARTRDEFLRVRQLADDRLSDYGIAKVTGIPRSTVRVWRRRELPPRTYSWPPSWHVPDSFAYSYLLGCYLGDGTVTHRSRNGWELRVSCDQRYPDVMDEIRAALALTFLGTRPTSFSASTGASDVVRVSHPGIGQAFPQHGPGPKHLRPIVLAEWQLEVTHREPEALIRGLIHSDGCRVVNRFNTTLPSGRVATYHYIRYFFSNLSADIRNIFVEHCELLGVRVTQSNPRNLSISHRDSVAILEEIVGPKT
jgi:hypothetical protein